MNLTTGLNNRFTGHYPFGMLAVGRSWEVGSGEGYRFGFQDQEIDHEFWMDAVWFKYRVEDPRLGRFFSIDPLFQKYPYWSPYSFAANQVILYKELEGLEIPQVPVTVPSAICEACNIDEWTFVETEEKIIEVAKRAAAVTLDAGIVMGGVLAIIGSAGTATVPMIIGVSTGSAAVVGGTTKGILDAQGRFEDANGIPASASGFVMITINYAVGNQVFSKETRIQAEIIEGILTVSIDDLGEVLVFSDVKGGELIINSINVAIDLIEYIPTDEDEKSSEIIFVSDAENDYDPTKMGEQDNTQTNLKELKVMDLGTGEPETKKTETIDETP